MGRSGAAPLHRRRETQDAGLKPRRYEEKRNLDWTSCGSFVRGGVASVLEEAVEHGTAGQEMEPALGGFGIGGLGAEDFAGGAEPIEPGGVLGSELLLEFLAEALGERGTFAVGGDGDLEIAALDDGAVVEVAVVDVVDGVAEDAALVGFEEDGGVDVRE